MTTPDDSKLPKLPVGMDENSFLTFDPMRTLTSDSKGNLASNILTVISTRKNAKLEDEERKLSPSTTTFPLSEKIGEGGFGEVWQAQQTSLGRMVAVKKLKEQLRVEANDSEQLSEYLSVSFEMEALTTAVLEHPNIVPIYDMGADHDERPMLAMKLVRGNPWDEVLKADFPNMAYREYLRKQITILIDVCQAVAFAHSRGIIHRDIKPSQVMIGEFGEVLLMDWGLAVVYDEKITASTLSDHEKTPTTTLSSAPNPAGTVAFMAPEQTDSNTKLLGPWTDVYLLGATLYYILTLKPPHEGSARFAMAQASVGAYTPIDEQANADKIPSELKCLVKDCLEPDVEKRKPLTAVDLVTRLGDYLTGAGAQDKAQELVERLDSQLESSEDNKIDYDSLLQCQTLLRQAREHWNHHPRYNNLEDTIHEKFARQGLLTGDLMLARMHAAQITDESTQHRVMTKVEAKQRQTEAIKRQRKLLLGSFVFFIAIILSGVMYYNTRLAEKQKLLAESLDRQSQLNFAMTERVKELTCLYGVTDSLKLNEDFTQVFKDVCQLIPPAWQFPDITTTRLIYDGEIYTSKNFQKSQWVQSASIQVSGENHGLIEVYYTEQRPQSAEGPFLAEERSLLDALAKLLGEAITQAEATKQAASLNYNIGEREKELQCVYGLIDSIATRNTIEEVAQDLLVLIPPAWQFPESTQCKIMMNNKSWASTGYTETQWQQTATITNGEGNIGQIIVSYTEEKPTAYEGPFLKEERTLLNALAAAMGSYLEKEI